MQDPSHYEVRLDWNAQDVVTDQYCRYLYNVPPHLRRQRQLWNTNRVARAYLTVKRKSLSDGLGRTCTKDHAHWREIIANSRDVLKIPLRVLSRCWQTALKQSGLPCWEMWNLSHAAAEIMEMHKQMMASCVPCCVCRRCGMGKEEVETIVADTSQLFSSL